MPPEQAVSNQGGEFRDDFQALLDRCGISSYHPRANGLTEPDRASQPDRHQVTGADDRRPPQLGQADPKGAAEVQIKRTGFYQVLSLLSAAWTSHGPVPWSQTQSQHGTRL